MIAQNILFKIYKRRMDSLKSKLKDWRKNTMKKWFSKKVKRNGFWMRSKNKMRN